jgi:protease-4
MRQALDQISARKPLVVAMGPVAGSGGYWVATPGRWVVARPSTLTGSIGVLTGKVVTAGLFDRLHVNRETVAFGKHSTIGSPDKPFSREEREIVTHEIDRVYEIFLDIVGRARHLTRDELHPISAGRVWTGRQAKERKLVDELGGLDAALRKARSLAGLKDSSPAREIQPPRRMIPPRAVEGAAGYIGWLLEGVALINRTPTLAVMNYTTTED